MAAQNEVHVVHQMQRGNQAAEVLEVEIPAADGGRVACAHGFKERAQRALAHQRLQRQQGVPAAALAAVAQLAAGAHLNVLEGGIVAVLADHDLAVDDTRSAQMGAQRKVDSVGQLRRDPQLRHRRAHRVVHEAAGELEAALKYVDGQARAAQNRAVDHAAPVLGGKSLRRDAHAQDARTGHVQRVHKAVDGLTDAAIIGRLMGKAQLHHLAAQLLPVQIHGNHLHPHIQNFHADGHPVVRHDGIGDGLAPDLVGFDLPVFADHAVLLKLRQVRRHRGARQTQRIEDVLLGDLALPIDVIVDLLPVVCLDLPGRDAFGHDGASCPLLPEKHIPRLFYQIKSACDNPQIAIFLHIGFV